MRGVKVPREGWKFGETKEERQSPGHRVRGIYRRIVTAIFCSPT